MENPRREEPVGPFTGRITIGREWVSANCLVDGCEFHTQRPHVYTRWDVRDARADLDAHFTITEGHPKTARRVELVNAYDAKQK
jgi:hypothetical protein